MAFMFICLSHSFCAVQTFHFRSFVVVIDVRVVDAALLMSKNAFIIYHISRFVCVRESESTISAFRHWIRYTQTHSYMHTKYSLVCVNVSKQHQQQQHHQKYGFQLASLSHFIQMVFREWCSNCCSFWLLFRIMPTRVDEINRLNSTHISHTHSWRAIHQNFIHYLNGVLSAEFSALYLILFFSRLIQRNELKIQRRKVFEGNGCEQKKRDRMEKKIK